MNREKILDELKEEGAALTPKLFQNIHLQTLTTNLPKRNKSAISTLSSQSQGLAMIIDQTPPPPATLPPCSSLLLFIYKLVFHRAEERQTGEVKIMLSLSYRLQTGSEVTNTLTC